MSTDSEEQEKQAIINKEKHTITKKDRYKFVTSQCVYHNEKIIQAFQLFTKLVAGFAGVVAWLRTEEKLPWEEIRPMASWILILIGSTVVVLIYGNVAAWWGFRKEEAKLTAGAAPEPRFLRSFYVELFMVFFIASATCLGLVILKRLQ